MSVRARRPVVAALAVAAGLVLASAAGAAPLVAGCGRARRGA